MRTPKLSTKRALGAAFAATLALGSTVALAGSSQAAVAAYTIAPATGPVTAGAVVTITGSGFTTAAGASTLFAGATAVQWTTSTCPTTHASASSTLLDSSKVAVASATKLVVTAPGLPLVASKATTYNVCVYGTASSNALLGTAKYTSYPTATITAANTPASGPAAGGGSVVVTGTGFTAASKVKFGSVLSPKVTVASNGLSLTAVAPAQAAGAVDVTVTTEGGANTVSTTTWDDYTYTNAITVSPRSGKSGVAHTVTVTGVGFKTAFASANTNAAVVWTRAGMTTDTDDIAACTNIQIVSDTELVCSTPTALTDGAYIVVVTSDDTDAAGGTAAYESVVSTSASFITADF